MHCLLGFHGQLGDPQGCICKAGLVAKAEASVSLVFHPHRGQLKPQRSQDTSTVLTPAHVTFADIPLAKTGQVSSPRASVGHIQHTGGHFCDGFLQPSF